jgi:glutaredoxin
VKIQVIIYSRPGCHLCEEAREAILNAHCEEAYALKEVNIENDPELLARYKDDIPVITFDGVEVFRHRVASEEFRRRILIS